MQEWYIAACTLKINFFELKKLSIPYILRNSADTPGFFLFNNRDRADSNRLENFDFRDGCDCLLRRKILKVCRLGRIIHFRKVDSQIVDVENRANRKQVWLTAGPGRLIGHVNQDFRKRERGGTKLPVCPPCPSRFLCWKKGSPFPGFPGRGFFPCRSLLSRNTTHN